MQKRLLTILVVALVFAMVPASAFADCAAAVVGKLAYGAAPGTPGDPIPATAAQGGSLVNYTASAGLPLAVEGKTERIADVLVWEDGAANYQCFKTNNNIRITFNAGITSSPSVTAPNVTYFDVYDTNQPNGLAITASTTQAQVPGGGTQTVVIVVVQQAGTYTAGQSNVSPLLGAAVAGAGSAFRIKNIRVDATSLLPVPTNATVNVTNSAGAMNTTAGLIFTGSAANVVGASRVSFTGASISAVGNGLQNSGTGLSTAATFTFAENAPGTAKQPAGSCNSQTLASDTCASQIANDIATGDTSFIFDAGTTLPSGVSVSWPTTITNSGEPAVAASNNGYILTLRNSPTCSGSGSQCFAIYDTTKGDTGGAATVTVSTTTGSTAANAAPTTNVNPTMGVAIASTSGAGTVTLHGFFGPAESSGTGCANDDVQATAVPRYVNTCTGTTAPTRNLFSGNWFTVTSNATALLYPYVTNLFGYQTGIVVSNTGSAGASFTTSVGQKGGLKFYFFPTNGTAFTLNTDITTGGIGPVGGSSRGLDANGQLSSGGVFASSLNDLLKAAGQPTGTSFDGYIIVVAGFQFAHGQVAVISADGTAAYSTVAVIPNAGGVRAVPEGLLQ